MLYSYKFLLSQVLLDPPHLSTHPVQYPFSLYLGSKKENKTLNKWEVKNERWGGKEKT